MCCQIQPIETILPTPFYKPVTYPDTAIGRVHRLRDYVCRRSYLTPERIQIKTNQRDIVLPKQIYCYLAAQWGIASLYTIGKAVGYVDHTMPIHGRDTIATMLETGQLPAMFKWVTELEKAGFESILPQSKADNAN